MVLTKEKLELEVKELEKTFDVMKTAKNFEMNMKRNMDEYMAQVIDTAARIDIIHKQIAEIVKEDQQVEKVKKAKEAAKVPVKDALKKEEVKK